MSRRAPRPERGRRDVLIRTACASDIPGLVALWIEFMDFHSALDPDFVRSEGAPSRWADHMASMLDDESCRIIVATEGDVLAGYVVATVRDHPPIRTVARYGFIQEIAVTRVCRRRGVARRLVRAAEAWLRATGVPEVEVRIDVANEASRALFAGEGFVPHTVTLIKKVGADA